MFNNYSFTIMDMMASSVYNVPITTIRTNVHYRVTVKCRI